MNVYNPTEYWASEYVYLESFRQFSNNIFMINGQRIEIMEVKQCQIDKMIDSSVECDACRRKWDQACLPQRLQSVSWTEEKMVYM